MKENATSLNDSPISEGTQDEFSFEGRIVSNIFTFLERDIKPCIIGITAPWGAGKTSVINLLKARIKKESYAHVDFDPMIEGKFEVAELIESFILKLSNIVDPQKLKSVLTSIALMLVPREISLGIPQYGVGLKWEDLDKKLENLIDSYKNNKSFSDSITELDKALKKKNLIVFIDEIDRLPAEGVIKFLLFARILEVFKNIRCIITFDYEKVVEKLAKHFDETDSNGKPITTNYLEKFFLVRYEVCSSLRIINLYNYTKKLLHNNEILAMIEDRINPTKYISIESDLTAIATFLETPRNCKRWLIELTKIKGILNNSSHVMDWLWAIALFIKNPMVLSDFARIKRDRSRSLMQNEEFVRQIENLERETKFKSENKFKDVFNSFDKNIPSYHISLFLDGIENEKECTELNEFIEGKVDIILEQLLKDGTLVSVKIDDLANMFYRDKALQPREKPSLDLLLRLWDKYRKSSNESLSIIIQRLLLHNDLNQKEVVNKISLYDLFLSEKHLINLLGKYDIVNENGIYCLNKGNKDFTETKKDQAKEYLRIWLDYVPQKICSLNDEKAIETISICYRYIQWYQSIADESDKEKNKADAQSKLTELAIECFKNPSRSKFKDNFTRLLSLGFNFENADNDHLKALFNRNPNLIKLIKDYADRGKDDLKLENYDRMFPTDSENNQKT